ncbi:MAG TPA: hypothetical protein VGE10_08170, partial [Zeimonas sp.]
MTQANGKRVAGAVVAAFTVGSAALVVPHAAAAQEATGDAEVQALAQRIEAGERRLRALEIQLQEERRLLRAVRRAFAQQMGYSDEGLAGIVGRGIGEAIAQAPVTDTPGVAPPPGGPVGE